MQTKENNVLKPFFKNITVNHNLNNELWNVSCFAVYEIKCTTNNESNDAELTVEKRAEFKFKDDAETFVHSEMEYNKICIIKKIK